MVQLAHVISNPPQSPVGTLNGIVLAPDRRTVCDREQTSESDRLPQTEAHGMPEASG